MRQSDRRAHLYDSTLLLITIIEMEIICGGG
jgi:hypothetical protein